MLPKSYVDSESVLSVCQSVWVSVCVRVRVYEFWWFQKEKKMQFFKTDSYSDILIAINVDWAWQLVELII